MTVVRQTLNCLGYGGAGALYGTVFGCSVGATAAFFGFLPVGLAVTALGAIVPFSTGNVMIATFGSLWGGITVLGTLWGTSIGIVDALDVNREEANKGGSKHPPTQRNKGTEHMWRKATSVLQNFIRRPRSGSSFSNRGRPALRPA